MNPVFKLSGPVAANMNVAPEDVLAAKVFLQSQGLYELPDWGVTPYPDRTLFKAIKAFQKSQGLKADGVMKPDGETETAIRQQARRLQKMGRNGDNILAHISPAEARMLKNKGGSGTVNPETGLLEFFETDKKKGEYIWHTRGDARVRSSHAERDGKTFSWNDPPAGGHPGDAPNCRCSAEDVKKDDKCKQAKGECLTLWVDVYAAHKKVNETNKKIQDAKSKLVRLRRELEKLKSEKPLFDLPTLPTLPTPPKGLGRRSINNWFREQSMDQWEKNQRRQQTASKMEQWESSVRGIEYKIQRTEEHLQKLESTLWADEKELEMTTDAWEKCLAEHGCPDY